jgi:hypothetical protein
VRCDSLPAFGSRQQFSGSSMSTKHSDPGTRDHEHRLFIPVWEVFSQTKYDALEKWINRNQAPFAWLLENLETLRDKRGYCSGSRIRSAFRDRYPIVAKIDQYKFNNNITKYLKYRIVYLKPDLHLFEFRHPSKRYASCPGCGLSFEVQQ